MSFISFIDDNFRLADSFLKRNYEELGKEIKQKKQELTICRQQDDLLAGCSITKNIPLTELFGDMFYVVRFSCANVNTLHDPKQLVLFMELFEDLNAIMNEKKGYYNLRVPSHIVDIVKAYNVTISNGMFCGGTVEEVIAGKKADSVLQKGLKIFFGSSDYVERHKKALMDMTYQSFKSYQGQYHISAVTEQKAGQIYESWIENSLDHCNDSNIIMAEYEGVPIGFVTIAEKDGAVEGVLSAVDGRYRQLGAYRSMISYIVNYAYEKEKAFITSTQFDNFIVQGVWNSIGLKPFYSIYNFHVDRRCLAEERV